MDKLLAVAASMDSSDRHTTVLELADSSRVARVAANAAGASVRASDDGRFHCPMPGCPSSFTLRANLQRHLRSHAGDSSHTCPACGRGFPRADQVRTHARTCPGPAAPPVKRRRQEAVPPTCTTSNSSSSNSDSSGAPPAARIRAHAERTLQLLLSSSAAGDAASLQECVNAQRSILELCAAIAPAEEDGRLSRAVACLLHTEHSAGCGHPPVQLPDGEHAFLLEDGLLFRPRAELAAPLPEEWPFLPPPCPTPSAVAVAAPGTRHAHADPHVHASGCGHFPVRHADHVDYLVNGRLHHMHGDHCDDHGPLHLLSEIPF